MELRKRKKLKYLRMKKIDSLTLNEILFLYSFSFQRKIKKKIM